MTNINKRNRQLSKLFNSIDYTQKITLYFSTKSVGDDFDPEEKNYTYTNLNPQTIRGIVRNIKTESLAWKNYGFTDTGAKEVLVEDRYEDWFKNCNKVEVDGAEYQVWKQATGNRVLIEKRPFQTIRVILRKME